MAAVVTAVAATGLDVLNTRSRSPLKRSGPEGGQVVGGETDEAGDDDGPGDGSELSDFSDDEEGPWNGAGVDFAAGVGDCGGFGGCGDVLQCGKLCDVIAFWMAAADVVTAAAVKRTAVKATS